MAQYIRSRALASGSLAEVAARLRADTGLPERRRQDMLAALNTVARVLGRGLDQIPGEPVLLSRRLAEANPAAHHVALRRWNNVRCLTRAALQRIMPVTPSRRRNALGSVWQSLWNTLPAHERTPLSRFMHFCDEQGISPEAVDQSVFDAFRENIRRSLRKKPEAAYAQACRAWNRAADKIPGWPTFHLAMPSRRRTWTLPWSAFPPSLQQEVQVWLDRLAGRDPLADLPFRPVRPSTVWMREYQLRQAASALVCRGRNPEAITGLADLVDLKNFKEILCYLVERRGGSAAGQVGHIAMLLKSVARHHVGVSAETLDSMAAIIRRIETGRRGMTEANRARLRPLDEREHALALVQLPARLSAEAQRAKRAHVAARLMQTALAVELLLMAPIRIGNLADLDIEQHLVRTPNGRQVSLVLEGHEVKNRESVEYPLPTDSVSLLDAYLRDHRPVLAETGTALFPGRGSRPKSVRGLRDQISQTIRRYTGLQVHPHLFRHIAAKLYLDSHPGGYEVVRRVLGHRSMNTTTAFYTGLETAAAVRHFDAAILRLRNGAKAA